MVGAKWDSFTFGVGPLLCQSNFLTYQQLCSGDNVQSRISPINCCSQRTYLKTSQAPAVGGGGAHRAVACSKAPYGRVHPRLARLISAEHSRECRCRDYSIHVKYLPLLGCRPTACSGLKHNNVPRKQRRQPCTQQRGRALESKTIPIEAGARTPSLSGSLRN